MSAPRGMRRVGYTPTQAMRLKAKIDRQVAKVEDAMAEIRRAVPDEDPNRYTNCGGIDGLLEEVRAIQTGLGETIDRRTI